MYNKNIKMSDDGLDENKMKMVILFNVTITSRFSKYLMNQIHNRNISKE